MSLFDDFENEEKEVENEYVWENFEFNWKGKKYTSIENFRKELSTEDLKEILKTTEAMIKKDSMKLNLANFRYDALGVLTFIGTATFFLNLLFTAHIKNTVSIFSLLATATGIIGRAINFKKYIPLEDKLDKLEYLAEEVDEELSLRLAQKEYNKKGKEIFEDMHTEEVLDVK